MRLGRCVSDSTKLGCSADVLEIVGRKCSGKRECEIRFPDSELEALKPCGEMWTYLEASYSCMRGEILTVYEHIIRLSGTVLRTKVTKTSRPRALLHK